MPVDGAEGADGLLVESSDDSLASGTDGVAVSDGISGEPGFSAKRRFLESSLRVGANSGSPRTRVGASGCGKHEATSFSTSRLLSPVIVLVIALGTETDRHPEQNDTRIADPSFVPR